MKFQNIAKVELIDDLEDYYDLSISSTHNYCLANGMVVHNTGVGYSVQTHHVEVLPVVQGPTERTRRFLIGDSIEGWADAVKVLMRAYFENKPDPVFDFRDIRPKGAKLITSGGKAPGPDPLRICLDHLRSVLNCAVGRKLTSVECHDIMCHIADAVLSGGIRRAALISLFSAHDLDMMSCKTGAWWELNPQRGRANNSVVLHRPSTTQEDFQRIWAKVEASGCGEPGFFWTNDYETLANPCVSGDALITVCDHGINGGMGVPYQIPMRMLYDMSQGTDLLPCAKSYNESTGKLEWKQITRAILTKKNALVLRITDVDSGKSVKVTPDHKIFTKNRGWVEAKDLVADDELVIENQSATSHCTLHDVTETEDVFDITVDGNHNFFADGILVHNCCEIALKDCQFCNLTELNVSDVTDQADLNDRVRAATILGTLQASYTDFHYLRGKWKDVTDQDALLGVGMTGIASGRVLGLDLVQAAEVAKQVNQEFAPLCGINAAARVTTIKPSGTSSLTVGSSSGIHAWFSDHYIRRMRVGKNEALYGYMMENFPSLIEPCQFKPHLEAVMSFPQRAPVGSITRSESALDLLERVKRFNTEWIQSGYRSGASHNNVSCTISVKPDEWHTVGDWMWTNRECYNGISVLPFDGGTYVQAPFEECDEATYDRMMKLLHEIDLTQVSEHEDNTTHSDQAACAGGKCEII